MSTTKGRVFEHYVGRYCEGFGLRYSRRVLSGGNLKRPYDVLVAGKLRIEAKRRTKKDAFQIQGEWLDEVEKRRILVFSSGSHPGQKLKIVAVCPLKLTIVNPIKEPQPDDKVYDGWLVHESLPGWIPLIKVKKVKTIPVDALKELYGKYPKVALSYNSKWFLMQDFKAFLIQDGYIIERNPNELTQQPTS